MLYIYDIVAIFVTPTPRKCIISWPSWPQVHFWHVFTKIEVFHHCPPTPCDTTSENNVQEFLYKNNNIFIDPRRWGGGRCKEFADGTLTTYLNVKYLMTTAAIYMYMDGTTNVNLQLSSVIEPWYKSLNSNALV